MYPAGSVDLFVLVATDIDKCWVIPAENLKAKSAKIPVTLSGKWEKYLEAWELIAQYSDSHETCQSRSVRSPSSGCATGSSAEENY